jgi:ferredoxin--NADP+ reductase
MFKVLESQMIVPNVHLLTFEAPAVSQQAKPGQFIIVRPNEDGERIPLSLSDWDARDHTVTVGLLNVGKTTGQIAALQAGMQVPTLVGPLGNPTEIKEYGTVLCIGGCYGIGSIYPITRALKAKGNKVIVLLEARSSYLFYWEKRFEEIADKVVYVTRDGTKGLKGHAGRLPEILQSLDEPVNQIIINGCTFLLKRGSDASRPLGIPTTVSLNPIMIDGTGMCGVCRVTVGSVTKFACVHGPDFDGHLVNWEELLQRRKAYLKEEVVPLRTSRCEEHMLKT